MPERVPSRYWVVHKPDEQGADVVKFETGGKIYISLEITNHDNFVVRSVPDQSSLNDHNIERGY